MLWSGLAVFLVNMTKGKVSQREFSHNTSYVGTLHRFDNNYSHTDKKKIESCNDKYKYYATGEEEHDDLVDLILENDCYGWHENHGETVE